ncbi:GspE/PulE family protein [bacterium]|nr:GspE/PulE family protein [bacterium]
MPAFERDREIVLTLIRQGQLTKQQAQTAYQAAKQSGTSILDSVVALGFVTREEVDYAAGQMPEQMLSLQQVEVDTALAHCLSRETAERLRAIPFRRRGDVVDVAMADPDDIHALDEVRRATRLRPEAVRVSDADISWALESLWSEEETKELDAQYAQSTDGLVEGDAITRLMDAPTIVKLASVLITGAIEQRASDIHLEPQRQGIMVRYRIDGVLKRTMDLNEAVKSALVSRIKIMADMNIAESRLPQDGRFTTTVQKRRVDVRVSSRPTIFGEKLVLRLLDKSRVIVGIDQLGFPPYIARGIDAMLHVSRGMILVVGATGSGKTTTLYAALHRLRSEGVNIESVEDPVEYQLGGINQSHVRPDIGLNFPEQLRSILRQDPDVILVGEVRDSETADMAFRAALTGHLVLSTMHANDAPAALVRCQEMKIEPYLVASALRCIIAQRLTRKLCEQCKVGYAAADAVADVPFLRDLFERHGIATLYRGEGCEECGQTGFRGRIGLFEMLRMSPQLRELVLTGTNEEQAREVAVAEGMELIELDALTKLKEGVTGIESLLGIYADRMTEFGEQVTALLQRRTGAG